MAARWPLTAHAQQQPLPVIGFLNGASPQGYEPEVNAFRLGFEGNRLCRGPECNDRISLGERRIRSPGLH